MATTFNSLASYSIPTSDGGKVPRKVCHVEITGDGAAYAAGGVAILPSNFGMTRIDQMLFGGCGTQGSGVGLVPHWDRVNSKLKLYQGTAAGASFSEATAAEYATTIVVTATVFGE